MTEKQNTQQGIQVPQEIAQQIGILNARIANANFANLDMLKEMDVTFKTMATTIAVLQKENAELKGKIAETTKNPKAE